jgi:cytochrome c oxidase assembly protein Cox11
MQSTRHKVGRRCYQTDSRIPEQANADTAIYIASTSVFVLGFAYASVPLYRAFCQVRIAAYCLAALQVFLIASRLPSKATGYGGTVNKHDQDRLKV